MKALNRSILLISLAIECKHPGSYPRFAWDNFPDVLWLLPLPD
jgi:hypothetical protein